MSSPSMQRLRSAAIPSITFAAVVFTFGWLPVSPFASWPLGLIVLLSLPALIPFVALVLALPKRQGGGRRSRGAQFPSQLSAPRLRWQDVLTPRRAMILGAAGILVFVSFFSAFAGYRGSPEVVDGELVFTDHGKVLGPATERQADEARTDDTRMFSGHLMLFGLVGMLARVPTATPSASARSRPATVVRTRGRPGGRRRRPIDGEP